MADKPLQSLKFQGLSDTYVNTPLSTAPTFDNTTAYAVGDYVFFNRKLYRFISSHTAGAWDNSQAEEVTVGSEIKNISNDVKDKYEKPSTGIPVSDLANGVIPDISNKEDKLTKSYTLIYEGTVTTATGELFPNPYASIPNYTLNEQYVYRVTVDGNTLESNVCEWYKPMTDGIKGSELIGNIYLSDPNLPSLIYEDTTKPYCLFYCGDGVYASLGLIIITETAGEHTVKLERVSINKSKLPRKMIYADENAPFDYSRINGSSYASINIGDNGTRNRGTAAIGYFNDTVASYGTAIGMLNVVSGQNATAIGLENTASGAASIAIGHSNTASGSDAFSEGCKSIASGGASHAEGFMSVSSGTYSHAEGYQTQAKKSYSHTEGASTAANANCSHAEGYATQTNGMCAHSEGRETLANSENQHSQGKWNIADSNGVYADIVGNGTADNNRSNAFALTWTGDGKFAGDVYVNCDADSTNGKKIICESDYASTSSAGIVKTLNASGISINNDHQLFIAKAEDAAVKGGTHNYLPIVPSQQHKSVFYGLAKAAGDSTQSESENTVGTYTDDAKIKIQKMLGIYEAPFRIIKEITISEETLTVRINTDSNGDTFELQEVIIYLKDTIFANNGSVGFGFNMGTKIYDENGAFLYCRDVATTTANKSIVTATIRGGRFFAECVPKCSALYNYNYINTSPNARGIIACDAIREITIRSVNDFKMTSGEIIVYGR